MNTPTRVAAFIGGLATIFAAATGVGALTGPVGTAGATSAEHGASPAEHGDSHTDGPSSGTDNPASTAVDDLPDGLAVSRDGYTLAVGERSRPATTTAPLQFQILGPDGRPVTRYSTVHDQDLHLIVVRRDLTRYQHVHPELDDRGTWSAPLDLSAPGVYRVFADFTPEGRSGGLTLGTDLSVAGDYRPAPLPAVRDTAEVDGYQVALDGTLEPGRVAELTLTVSKDGRPVTDLQPYLGAYGHLVALRDRDLAYLHVHPDGTPGDGRTRPGPAVTFHTTVPSAGEYRLFLDFRHGDRVRTAAFTGVAGSSGAASGSEGGR